MNNRAVLKKAFEQHSLIKHEIVSILEDNSINEELFNFADETRRIFVGNKVHLRGLIEFSNICKCNCHYCGLRKDNSAVERYRMDFVEIIALAESAKKQNYKTLVLQSGEDSFFDVEKMQKIISAIKKMGFALTLSLGEKTFEEYKAFKEAGADRYLLRIETTDENLYKKLHPNMSFENRKKCLADLKKLGFETGTGCLVGLPEQSLESIADDILFFKELNADMVGLGPFIPAPNTPLATKNGGSLEKALKIMALTRLLLPDINIPATTAMETIEKNGRIKALKSGANVVMPNVTNEKYKKKYEIYPEKAGSNTASNENKNEIVSQILSIGREISTNYGFRATCD